MNDLAFSLKGVGKKYPFFALENINLDLPAGTIMGLIGPNGAGKSTTIRILMGLVHQDRGDVQVLGHPMPAEQVAAKWDIGFASEDMRLYDPMTLAWHMNFIRAMYPTWDPAYAQLLLKRFGLRAEQKINGLSHGQRVKSVLLLDARSPTETTHPRRTNYRPRSGCPSRSPARTDRRHGRRRPQHSLLIA